MKNFFNKKEKKIIEKFSNNGFIIFNIDQKNKLSLIKKKIILELKKVLKIKKSITLEKIHQYIDIKDLNNLRLKIYTNLNKDKNFLENYYSLGKEYLNVICGNELVMQRKVNLSIQLPKDDSSLLPLHSDVWSGCSPYEVVLWIPMVNCKKTQSMFILPKSINDYYYNNFQKFNSVSNIEKKLKKKFKWLKINYGQGIIFQHSIMHGNVVNQELSTRWSFNCRFKSIFSPYDDKSIGETFIPITLRPASNFGMNYKNPKVKNAQF
jgi:sporadic carbohydrate cluster 2OG-Fe(II) oxygenase